MTLLRNYLSPQEYQSAKAEKLIRRAGPATLRPIRRVLHARQLAFRDSTAKRKVIRAGRRGGKTVGIADIAIERFCAGRRVLYATPTQEQIDAFWWEVTTAFANDIDAGRVYKNETKHIIEIPGTKQRIRAKTAWNADTLRGDYADDLILDEWQLANEDAWRLVGAPMLLDNNGDAVFAYTPPSLHSRSTSKATDKLHASKLYKKAKEDTTGRWAAFHFTSHDNPYISTVALAELSKDMTALAIRQEIGAEDDLEVPGALWHMADTLDPSGRVLYGIDSKRVTKPPNLIRVVTAIDPSATSGGDEAGIITAGAGMCSCRGELEKHAFVIADNSLQASPRVWATAAVTAYNVHKADRLVAEKNNGGEMVELTIQTVEGAPAVSLVNASRGKATRAEPIAALYEQGKVHHVGEFPVLETEMVTWTQGDESPNHMDALVWALTELDISTSYSMFPADYYIDDDAD